MIDSAGIHPSLRGEFHSCSSASLGRPAPNLLVLFHGQGDTHKPFHSLAKSLNLPQTDTLALGAPFPIPLLYEEAWEWMRSFTSMGEPIPDPDPTEGLSVFSQFFAKLSQAGYPPSSLHFLGYGQGASFCTHLLLHTKMRIKSLTCISAPMLTLPPSPKSDDEKNQTPVLLISTKGKGKEARYSSWWDRAFACRGNAWLEGGNDVERMPKGRQEWEPIMRIGERFWASNLTRQVSWQNDKNVIEITPGKSNVTIENMSNQQERAIWDFPINATSTFDDASSTSTVNHALPITETIQPSLTSDIKAKPKSTPKNKEKTSGLRKGFLL